MKQKIIGWAVFTSLLLVIGIGIFRSVSEKKTENRVEEIEATPLPVNEGEVISYTPVKSTNAVVAVSGRAVPVDDPAALNVLSEKQEMTAHGEVVHTRLIKRDGKYPNRILMETLQRDQKLRRYISKGSTEMVADHILVQQHEGISFAGLEQLALEHNASILRSLSDGKTHIVKLEAPGLDAVQEAISFFTEAAAEVAYAEPDYVSRLTKTPNDPDYVSGDLWGIDKIDAPLAWDISAGSRDVVVAVIDSGMDMDHPDLLANLWINENEFPDGLDNDGNGYVDDIHGWDFVMEDDNPDDENGHGTHVAGTIGAVGNNVIQVAGVCWEVSIMPVRAGDVNGELLDSDIAEGIQYAVQNGAKVIANSYGRQGFPSQTIEDRITEANEQGVMFVVAAGNGGPDGIGDDNDVYPFYPANYDVPNVISVAASDQDDDLTSFSNFGVDSVDLAAPGFDILSTYLNGGTTSLPGTSMACPHVAGALALLASIDPTITPEAAKQLLLASVDAVPSMAGKTVTGGRLNVHNLLVNVNDTDLDGMPDSWELLYGFNINDPSDAALDTDGDFLSNLQEFQKGCNPTNADTDADSLVDGWEIQYNFNPLDMHTALPRLQHISQNESCQDAYDIAILDGYAYVADGANGLCILDVSDPQKILQVGTYDSGGSARGVEVVGDHAYLSDLTTGLHIIDVSNPDIPVLLGNYDTTAYNAAVLGNYVFVAVGENGIEVISVANPATPYLAGTFDSQFISAYDVKLSGTTAYLAGEGYITKVDVSNPVAPAYLDAQQLLLPSGLGTSKAMFFNGTEFFLALENYGFSAYDEALAVLARIGGASSALGICEDDGLVFIADGSAGLRVMNAANLSAVTAHAHYEGIFAQNVTFHNGYAYVASRQGGMHVFRASTDIDGDGLYDKWEQDYFGSLSETWNTDFDGDGINNWGEFLVGLIPTNSDQDADTLIDGDEVKIHLTDPRKFDTDDDGVSDADEVNVHGTNPLLKDSDADGMDDKWEIDNGLNPLVDDADLDADSDGATNIEESLAGTDPQDADTDNDGMPDGWEIDMGIDPLVDDAANDDDSDTFTNLAEYNHVTNNAPYFESTHPKKADSDDDGLTDPQEINIYLTDPNNPDTDGDGMPDGWEIANSLNPFVDDSALDLDGDGLSNYEEYLNGSSPDSNDTDADGFTDDWERDWGTSATNAADPLVVDDDHPDDPDDGRGDPLWSNTNENGSVQAPFDAIQEAIDVATNGAVTILVMDGNYVGPGNFDIRPYGKELMIRSFSGSANTTVNSFGGGAGFVFDNDESTNTVLKGFSITTTLNACSDGSCDQEHGIVCEASSPRIEDCVIFECELRGISCQFASAPIISNCVVRSCLYGIYAENGSTPVILDSLIENSANHIALEKAGFGIIALDSDGLVISNCVVTGTSGRGLSLFNDPSAVISDTIFSYNLGGMVLDNSSPVIERCEFRGNIAPEHFEINGNHFLSSQNQAESCAVLEGWVDVSDEDENGGGILCLRGSFPYLENALIVSNKTVAVDPEMEVNDQVPDFGLGGGIFVGEFCDATAVNCTIADNTAFTRGGGFSSAGPGSFLRNMIVWGNDAFNHYLTEFDVLSAPSSLKILTYPSMHCRSGTIGVWYSNLEFGYQGGNNIDLDPQFASAGNYRLVLGSPCIDSGGFLFWLDPLIEAPNHDIEHISRPLDGDGNGSEHPDMGAYEFINPVADTDGDGMPDDWERIHGLDLIIDDGGLDPDSDGLSNLEEYNQLFSSYGESTDPNDSDSDNDGLLDGDEVNTHGTDPNNPDTDGDGLSDKWEVDSGLDPLVPSAGADDDGDGASNYVESLVGTDPLNPDTDGDGMPDGWEIDNNLDPLVNDAALNPDGDVFTNSAEFSNLQEYNQVSNAPYFGSTNPHKADSDDDGLSDTQEIELHGTDPNNPDTDGDGMPDDWELANGLNPLVDDADIDTDSDGLSNYHEFLNGSSPDLADTDADGYADDWEFQWGTQATNAADPVLVDDDHPADPAIYDPTFSNPNEDGSLWRPFDAIQEGIDAAEDGMLVLVTNGYYIGTGNMNIDTKGKAIRVLSYSGNADTFIDADGLGAGFVFSSGEGSNTLVAGFTITSPPGDCADGSCGYEHGVVCSDGSSPVIEDCYIFGCALNGVQCIDGSSPVLRAVEIESCSEGIHASSGATPVIENVSISGCRRGIQSTGSVGLRIENSSIANCYGRGLLIVGDSALEVVRTRVADNLGGMTLKGCFAVVDQCAIENNIAPDYASTGKYSYNIALQAARSEGSMSDMTDEDENGAGIMLLDGSVLNMQNSLLTGNNAVALDPDYPETKIRPDYGLGGGLYIGPGCFSTNMNCTYADNEARRGGGISSHGFLPDYVRNTVLWDNYTEDKWVESDSYTTTNWVPGNIEGGVTNMVPEVTTHIIYWMEIVVNPIYSSLHCRDGAFNVWYCDVENGGSYINQYKRVIEADPMFGTNHTLLAGSPCIDEGTPFLAPLYDIDGIARPLDGDNNGISRHDIGAFETVHALADSDNDGMLDQDEINTGTNPTAEDSDDDGMSDGFEAMYGLDAMNDDANADADGDGLSNLAEAGNGTDPTKEDTDGDNSPDGDEDVAGTIPTDPASYFYVSNVQPLAGGGCDITFDTVVGRTYTVYCCTELGGAWMVVLDNISGDGNPAVINDPESSGNCFYKVEVYK